MVRMYTDGSCLGNPGKGGWGAIALDNDEQILFELSGGEPKSTNNIMELTAVIKGLEQIQTLGVNNVTVITDSKYVSQGITSWMGQWIKKDWKRSDGKPVKNKELWIQLHLLNLQITNIQWEWVKAHNGNKWNEKVDNIARNCALTQN